MARPEEDAFETAAAWMLPSVVRGIVRHAAGSLGRDATQWREIRTPVAFSRADALDLLKLISLWNGARGDRLSRLGARACPGCQGRDHSFIFASYDGYPFHVCKACDTWFVPLHVDEAVIEGFYTEVPQARVIADRMMAGREQRTRSSDRDRFSGYFDLIRRALPPGERSRLGYLDIGCGVGHSVELAQDLGFDAVGIELNRVAVETARASKRKVYHPVEWREKRTFDVVSMFETLEHVTSPDDILADLVQNLTARGIVMITVPNGAGWEARLLRERSLHVFGGYEGVGHINLFTPEGLRRLLLRHGLAVLHLDGQYGNNALEIAAGLLDQRGSAVDGLADGVRVTRLPESLHDLLNAVGPDLAALDRLTLRSPVLLALACRVEAQPDFAEVARLLEQERREGIRQDLPLALDKRVRSMLQGTDVPELAVPRPAMKAVPLEQYFVPEVRSLFASPGAVPSVGFGLTVRSSEPLQFERMALLGQGRLAAGRYDLAMNCSLHAGQVTLSLADQVTDQWLTTVIFEPGDGERRTEFTLDRDTNTALYVCAHNSDGPVPTRVEIHGAGLSGLSEGAAQILPPPMPAAPAAPPAPLAFSAPRITGFLSKDAEGRALGSLVVTAGVASGLLLRSGEAMRFERMAQLGRGRLAAGTYELGAQAIARRGRVSFSLFDEAGGVWATSVGLEPGADEVRTTMTLARDADISLFVCAHNSDGACLTDVDIFDIGIVGLSEGSGLLAATAEARPREPAGLFDAAPDAEPLHGILLPAYDALAASRESDSIATSVSFHSDKPLRFEYMARLGRCTLAKGRYMLATGCNVREGFLSLSLLDTRNSRWIAAVPVGPGQDAGHVEFAIDVDTPCILYLCANNSEKPAPVHIDVRAVGIAALEGGGLVPEKVMRETRDRRGRKLLASFPELSASRTTESRRLARPAAEGHGRVRTRSRVSGLQIYRDMAAREYLHKGAELALPAGTYRLRVAGRIDAGALAVGILDEVNSVWVVNVALAGGESWGEQEFLIEAPLLGLLIVSGNNAVPGQIAAEITAIDLHAIVDP